MLSLWNARRPIPLSGDCHLVTRFKGFWSHLGEEQGQAVAEYAAMLGLLMVLLYTLKIIGIDANHIFNVVASMIT